MTRLNKILAALVAVQLVLAVIMLSRDGGGGLSAPTALTAGLDAKAITRIQVFAKRERTATGDDKPAVDLVKKGDAWVVASAFDYPVDATKIETLVGNLGKLESRGPIATSASRHAQLAVADTSYERKLVITGAGGDRVIYVGGSAGAQRTAVRIGKDAAVHAVASRDLSAWSIETEAQSWVARSYLDIAKDDIQSVTVKTGKGTVALDHSTGSWLVTADGAPYTLAAGESINTGAIDTAVAKVAKVELAAPADPSRDASAPTATITVAMKPPAADPAAGAAPAAASAPDRVIDVIADGDRFWVHERGNPRAVLVDRYAFEDVVELGRAKLVSAPPAKGAPPAAGGQPQLPPGAMPPGMMPPGMVPGPG